MAGDFNSPAFLIKKIPINFQKIIKIKIILQNIKTVSPSDKKIN